MANDGVVAVDLRDPRDRPATLEDLRGARVVICPGGTFMLVSVHNLRGVYLGAVKDFVCVFSSVEKFRETLEPTDIVSQTERGRGDTLRLSDPLKDPASLVATVKRGYLGTVGIALDPCRDEAGDWHLREVVEHGRE